jgi:hypothetical protein
LPSLNGVDAVTAASYRRTSMLPRRRSFGAVAVSAATTPPT